MKAIATASVLTIAILVGTARAGADAVADQKKAYHALGIRVGKKQPAMCFLASKNEVERYVGKPLQAGESAGPVVTGCAWHAADGTNAGALVTRDGRTSWHPDAASAQFRRVSGVGEQAYTAFQPGIGYEAGALGAKGVTTVLLSGKQTADAALGLLRVVMNR